MELTQEQQERKRLTEESVRESEKSGPCDNSNPAIVCFALSMLPAAQVLLKESNTPMEGLVTAIAQAICEGIDLAKHSGEWSLLAKEEFLTSLKGYGFDNQMYPGETEEVLHAFTLGHPMQHTNPEQDEDMEKSQNERAHHQEVDAAYEAGKAAAE